MYEYPGLPPNANTLSSPSEPWSHVTICSTLVVICNISGCEIIKLSIISHPGKEKSDTVTLYVPGLIPETFKLVFSKPVFGSIKLHV